MGMGPIRLKLDPCDTVMKEVTMVRTSIPKVEASMRAITLRLVSPQLLAAYVVSQKTRLGRKPFTARWTAQASAVLALTGSAFNTALPGRPKM